MSDDQIEITEQNWKEVIELALEGKVQLNFKVLKSFRFGNLLYHADNMLKMPTDDEDVHLGFLYAAILFQAAALECFLNDEFIEYAEQKYGAEGQAIAESLISGSMRSKINRIVPILTQGKKRLDLASKTVQSIFEMLKERNKIAHTVEHYRHHEAGEYQDDKPTLEQCQRFGAALNMFIAAIHNSRIRNSWENPLFKEGVAEDGENR
jgi:hypothetical protein